VIAAFLLVLSACTGPATEPAASPRETAAVVTLAHRSTDDLFRLLEDGQVKQLKPATVSLFRSADATPPSVRSMVGNTGERELIIVGPAEDVAKVVELVAALDVPPLLPPDPHATSESLAETLAQAVEVQDGAKPAAARLVYELPVEPLQRALREAGEQTADQMLAETVETVQVRIGADGKVARAGSTGFTVEVADGSAERVAHMRRRIEDPGLLEIRILASADYVDRHGRRLFDLDREKIRLEEWLDHGHKAAVRKEPQVIDKYNDDADHGPYAGDKLRWYPHFVTPRWAKPAVWNFALSATDLPGWVACYEHKDFNNGMVPAVIGKRPVEQQWLLEFIAVNMDERHFTGADLDRAQIAAGSNDGTPCVYYRLRADVAAQYADWSQKHRRNRTAIILNGVVQATPPLVLNREAGRGLIVGDYSPAEAEDLAAILRSRLLPVTPLLIRQEAVPAEGR
jgi:hypothetical protein